MRPLDSAVLTTWKVPPASALRPCAAGEYLNNLWGREKINFEPLRQTKDLAGTSRQTRRSGWPPNTETADTVTEANNLKSRSFLAYRSIFSQMKAPAGGLISLFSHKVHSFFGKLCGAGNATR